MTILSHAKDASDKSQNAQAVAAAKSGEAAKGGLGDLMKQVLRAGNAASKVKTDGSTSAIGTAKAAKTDPVVTGSTASAAKVKDDARGTRPYHSIISRYAGEYGVPVSLAHAVVSLESNYRPTARGRAGEIGLMQIKPSTARMMGYSGSAKHLYEPETNIKYGMKYLAQAFKLGGGNTCTAILKYNAGHAAKRMNPVSSAYCQKVKRILASG